MSASNQNARNTLMHCTCPQNLVTYLSESKTSAMYKYRLYVTKEAIETNGIYTDAAVLKINTCEGYQLKTCFNRARPILCNWVSTQGTACGQVGTCMSISAGKKPISCYSHCFVSKCAQTLWKGLETLADRLSTCWADTVLLIHLS